MKVLNKFLQIMFLLMSGIIHNSFNGMPIDLLGSLAPEKKLHNKIASSISGSAKKSDINMTSGPAEQKAKNIESMYTADKDAFIIPELPPIPKEVSEVPVENKTPVTIHSAVLKENNDKPKDVIHHEEKKLHSDQNEHEEEQKPDDQNKNLNKADSNGHQQHNTLDKHDQYDTTEVTSYTKDEHDTLYQNSGFIDDSETVVFNFEETDLLNVANYMEIIHNIKFVSEDILSTAKDAKGLAGHKVTFRTNKVLTKKESWDLFLTFLHIAGLDVVPMSQVGFYKIVSFAKANSETIPTYIGVDASQLPDNDMVVRYVYFAKSIEPSKISPILMKMQAGSAKLEIFTDLKALIFTDRACNIKSLMQIVKELDKSALPETLSVVKLKRANAQDVIDLYKSLKPTGNTQQPQRVWVPGRKEATLEYFPQDVSTFADKRTNSLILLGPEKGVRRIEEFIQKHIDIAVDRETPEIYTYQLQYTNANSIAQTLNSIVQYNGGNTTAGQYGSVRNDVKFFGKMTIVPENQSNSLIINAAEDDYEALKPLIKELDIPQKQIGIEVLIVTVADGKTKSLGSQLSGPNGPHAPTDSQKKCQTFGQSVAAQTAALSGGVVTTQGGQSTDSPDFSIKSSLASLLGGTGTFPGVGTLGSLVVTFGQPIWSIFKILNTIASTHVIANPFLVASNNTQASLSIGTTRNITTSQQLDNSGRKIQGFRQGSANLNLQITPQINKGNIINLDISVTDNSFILPDENSALQDNKSINTTASIANGEVLVLGGIMTERYNASTNGVPFLENIPLLGWFFKSKNKSLSREHFLMFICPKLLEDVDNNETIGEFTKQKMIDANNAIIQIDEADWFASKKDPIERAFFKEDTTKKFRLLDGKDKEIVPRAKIKKQKHQQKNTVIKPSGNHRKTKVAYGQKKNKKSSFATLSFDKDFVNAEESSSARIKSISDVIGQEDKLHV